MFSVHCKSNLEKKVKVSEKGKEEPSLVRTHPIRRKGITGKKVGFVTIVFVSRLSAMQLKGGREKKIKTTTEKSAQCRAAGKPKKKRRLGKKTAEQFYIHGMEGKRNSDKFSMRDRRNKELNLQDSHWGKNQGGPRV